MAAEPGARDTVALGIIAGLVVGKPLGILLATFLLTRLPGIALDRSFGWVDLLGLSFVAGIGFTVSLLVGELSYGATSETDAHVKIGVLLGSPFAALVRSTSAADRRRVDSRTRYRLGRVRRLVRSSSQKHTGTARTSLAR